MAASTNIQSPSAPFKVLNINTNELTFEIQTNIRFHRSTEFQHVINSSIMLYINDKIEFESEPNRLALMTIILDGSNFYYEGGGQFTTTLTMPANIISQSNQNHLSNIFEEAMNDSPIITRLSIIDYSIYTKTPLSELLGINDPTELVLSNAFFISQLGYSVNDSLLKVIFAPEPDFDELCFEIAQWKIEYGNLHNSGMIMYDLDSRC